MRIKQSKGMKSSLLGQSADPSSGMGSTPPSEMDYLQGQLVNDVVKRHPVTDSLRKAATIHVKKILKPLRSPRRLKKFMPGASPLKGADPMGAASSFMPGRTKF